MRARHRVQDEGSQLIAELAGRGTEILDCCAAPGGKTAILAERNPTASITACDISPTRLKAMQSLLGRPPNIHFRVLDATELPFQNQFDLVLCDAPCSGTGTLARNPEIKHRITTADFQRHHDRQLRLLRSAMRAHARRRQAHLLHLLPGNRRKRVCSGGNIAAREELSAETLERTNPNLGRRRNAPPGHCGPPLSQQRPGPLPAHLPRPLPRRRLLRRLPRKGIGGNFGRDQQPL